MGDAENELPPSKKRVAGRQLTKDDPPEDDDFPETEMGTFKKASEEVMATRRIVKVRRSQPAPAAASSNPFAGIRLVAPVDSSAQATEPINSPENCTAPPGECDTTENSAVTDAGIGNEARDSSNKIEDRKEDDKKLDDSSKPAAIGDGGDKNHPVQDETQPQETTKEAENGEGKTEGEALDAKTADQQEQIEKEDTETKEETGEEKTENQQGKIDKEATESKQEVGEKSENAVELSEKEAENDQKDPAVPAAPLNSFQQLSSSQNAFSGLAGTGFSTSSFAFGSVAKEGATFGTSSSSLFSNSSLFSFGTGSVNGNSSSSLSAPDASKSVKLSMPEVPLETGEENENAVFTADAVMYEYLDGGWKERGKGELKLNVSISDAEKARLVMRAKGNFRLILNASLYPDMSLTNMDKRGVTFACINSGGEGKDGLTTVALKFKDSSIAQEFRELVMTHKGQKVFSEESEPPKDSTKESNE
ncbi:hypothetical protein Cni_G03264 [Canna indica]|uniref:RanBD1 domain-containing protein n=1 Tax=Canna indica TaxID=4628 RepID=A0AAQ3Q103_9LILI|nr:hypothetical protein Cni_G03264 [Canna indica]